MRSFLHWVFRGRNTPGWVKASAYGITMGLVLAAWVGLLKYAPAWMMAVVLIAAAIVWAIAAIRSYQEHDSD